MEHMPRNPFANPRPPLPLMLKLGSDRDTRFPVFMTLAFTVTINLVKFALVSAQLEAVLMASRGEETNAGGASIPRPPSMEEFPDLRASGGGASERRRRTVDRAQRRGRPTGRLLSVAYTRIIPQSSKG